MAWMWRYRDAAGAVVTGPNETFGSQSDAESWVGLQWRALAEGGVVAVSLYDDDRLEYDMSLAPEAR
jgi:hypothetical protein